MNLSDLIVSLIRTVVPIGVGVALNFLGRYIGVLPEGSEAVTTWLTGALIAAYYAVARVAETQWPWIGVLLGSRKPPTYDTQG